MSVDAIGEAVDRAYPAFRGRSGDWEGVVSAAPPLERRRRPWLLPALAAGLSAAALLLFWPGGASDDRVLQRALAAVDDGPVIHLVLQTRTAELYDLESRRARREPVLNEIWFDPRRGIHGVLRFDGRIVDDVLLPPGQTEVDRQYLGLGAAYRQALRDGNASVDKTDELGGRRVYWISFDIRYPEVGIPAHVSDHSVAIDAQTYEPRAWRQDGREQPITLWETLPAGRGDFKAARTLDGTTSEHWYGVSRVGLLEPEEAGTVLSGAVWLGRRYGDVPLAFIREVRYETGMPSRPLDPDQQLPGLEVCYGRGEPCRVLISQATRRHPMIGRFGWDVTPPPGSMILEPDGRHALVVREDGLYVVLEAGGRDVLIAAAEALTEIP